MSPWLNKRKAKPKVLPALAPAASLERPWSHWSRWAQRLRSQVRRPQPLYLPGGTDAPLPPLRVWQDWCAAHPGEAVQLWLAGEHTHQLLWPGVDSALNSPQQARAQWLTHYGAAAQHWPLVSWSQAGAHGVCALHGLDLTQLLAVARAHRVRVRSLQPWWAGVLNGLVQRVPELVPGLAQGQRVALGVVEPGVLTWLVCDHACLLDITQRRFGPTLPLAQRVHELLQQATPPFTCVCLVGHGLPEPMQPALADPPWRQLTPLHAATPQAVLALLEDAQP